MTNVLFLGLGHMGGGMAANLVRAGFDVRGSDPSAAAMHRAEAAGVTPSSVAEANDIDIVMTSLPGPAQIRAVGIDDGLLATMRAGATWIDLSTNDIATARALADAASERGVALIDAPVSGGPEGAAAGTLSVYVGGPDAAVAACEPVFAAIGHRFDHLGPHGAGYVAKIAQVTLCYTQTIAFVEALMLGVKGGVAAEKMCELIQHSAGGSYVADNYGPEIVAGRYDESFPIALAAKDIRLAMAMAQSVGADLPFMARVAERYEEAERRYGPTAPHLLAAQITETENDLTFHEEPTR